jgi:hypothetical protein
MAEWLRTGLQIRLRRFDSGSGLHGRNLRFFRSLFAQFGATPLQVELFAALQSSTNPLAPSSPQP